MSNNTHDNSPRPEGEGLGVRATQYISREMILRILETIEPFINLSQPNLQSLVNEAAQYDHNCNDLREVWEQVNVPKEKRGAYALLTLVAEDLLNGAAAINAHARGYTIEPNGASTPLSTSAAQRRGAGGEVKDAAGDEDKAPAGPTTLYFIYVERGESKGSKWEFRTVTGEKYWALDHKIEERNTIPLFTLNGYHELRDMQFGDCLRWNKYPIAVEVVKDAESKFWKAQKVTMRPAAARPDSTLLDCITSARKRAALKDIAEFLPGFDDNGNPIVIVDTETTGTGTNDEIIEFAALNLATGEFYETLISTHDNSRINATTHIHGITEEMLNAAPKFEEIAPQIEAFLDGKTIVAYNREFDMRLLRQTWEQHERPFPDAWNAVNPEDDIMLLMTQAIGDPGKYGDAQYISLAESAQLCQIETRQTHRAFADVRLTHEVIKAAAAVYEQVKDVEFIPADMDDIPF